MPDQPMTALEGLYAARERLEGKQYVYGRWTACTCGHIYKGATGRDRALEEQVLHSEDDLYRAVMERIIAANRLDAPLDGWYEPTYARALAVSNATRRIAEREEVSSRKAALRLVQVAIHAEEADQQRHRLEVLERAGIPV